VSKDKGALEFLFTGPLFSIFRSINQIRRDFVSFQEQVDAIAVRLSAVSSQLAEGFDEVRGKISELEAAVAAGGSADFSAVNAALDTVAGQAQSLDDIVPDTAPEPTPEPEPVVAEADSPGEA
jgi:ABC-type transporter Mla subunit MlaD